MSGQTEDSTMGGSTPEVHVRQVEIVGLFRQYHHVIPIHQTDRVTILHGRNGVGKTVTLSLIAALLQGNYRKLAKFPFERLRLDFTDGSYLEVVQTTQAKQSRSLPKSKKRPLAAEPVPSSQTRQTNLEIRFQLVTGESHRFNMQDVPPIRAEQIARSVSWVHQVNEDRWIDTRSGMVLDTDEVAERYGSMVVPSLRDQKGELGQALSLGKRVPVHFVEAQRLVRIRSTQQLMEERMDPSMRDSISSVVQAIAKEMSDRIKGTDSTYRATSTRLDDSLPNRLFTPAATQAVVPEELLSQRAGTLGNESARLHRIGLLPAATRFDPKDLDATQRAQFVVYLADNEQKLGVFKELADRAEILLEILNRKFAPKRIELDKDDGYRVWSHDQQVLHLDMLSSGEQHELVLLHNLLFRVERGALLLIDEPELSLHVTWQTEFLEDLIRVARQVGFDALLATHSPYIVGNRRDLTVQLGAPE